MKAASPASTAPTPLPDESSIPGDLDARIDYFKLLSMFGKTAEQRSHGMAKVKQLKAQRGQP